MSLKKIINRKVYNTETADKVGTAVSGMFGDPAGYEESLYKTKKGLYFLHGIGGAESPYPEEDIKALTEKEATAWMAKNAQ